MKKVLYIILFSVVSSLAITSCTEEDVKPSNDNSATAGGGTGADPTR